MVNTKYLKRHNAVRLLIEAIPNNVRRNPVAVHIFWPMSQPSLNQNIFFEKIIKVLTILTGQKQQNPQECHNKQSTIQQTEDSSALN